MASPVEGHSRSHGANTSISAEESNDFQDFKDLSSLNGSSQRRPHHQRVVSNDTYYSFDDEELPSTDLTSPSATISRPSGGIEDTDSSKGSASPSSNTSGQNTIVPHQHRLSKSPSPTPSALGSSSPPGAVGITLDPGSPSPSNSFSHGETPQVDSFSASVTASVSSPGAVTTSTGEILPAPIIPPYWQTHTRSTSSASGYSFTAGFPSSTAGFGHSGKPQPIRLEDNTLDEEDDRSGTSALSGLRSPLWARVVIIDSYTLVSGNVRGGGAVGIGDYVVWSCKVDMLDGGKVHLHKRYSEFETLRHELRDTFPRAGTSLPALPPKSVFYRFRPAFLEKRRAGLEYFLNCVLLNPEFAGSAVLKEFVFS